MLQELAVIEVERLMKHYRVHERPPGMGAALRSLFSRPKRLVKAVDGISFRIEAAERVGFLGPNGAGKTTTLKMLSGLLLPTAGQARVAIRYALWIMVVSLAFKVVKIDNMSHLFVSLFEAARWPSSVFRGALSLLFTFVIPLALMTTYPALAVLGRARASHFLTAVAVAALLLVVSRWVWQRSVRSYTGASS